MTTQIELPKTLAEVLMTVAAADLPAARRRDMISAIKRICEMVGWSPSGLAAETVSLRGQLGKIRPAAAGINAKTFANLRSLLIAALQLAGVTDSMGRGYAGGHSVWGPLVRAIASDKRLSNGLAAFLNWC